MPDADVPVRSRRGCLFYGLLIFFGVPLLLLMLIIAMVGWRESAARSRLNARLDAIRSAGEPVDGPSLDSFYQAQTSDASTEAWLALLAELGSDAFNGSIEGVSIFDGKIENGIPAAGEPWAEEAAVRAFLEQWRDTHDRAMRLGIDGQPTRFPINWDSFNTLLPQTQAMRQVARLLQLRGELAIYDSDPAAARRAVDALLGCAGVLDGEPVLVSQLVATAIDGIGLGLLKKGLEAGVFREQDLTALLPRVLERIDIGQQWRLSLLGERAMMLPIFEDPELMNNLGGPSGMPMLPFRSGDANHFLDFMESALAFETSDLDTFRTEFEAHEKQMQELLDGRNIFAMLDTVITGMITPALSSVGSAFVRKAMQHRATALVMGVRLYELEHGAFPESLSELEAYGLVAADLMPPGGKQFGYQVADDGATLWGFDAVGGERSVPSTLALPEDGEAYEEQKLMWIWQLSPSETASRE